MQNHKNDLLVPVLLAVIAILIVGGGAYIFNIKNAAAPTLTPAPASTAVPVTPTIIPSVTVIPQVVVAPSVVSVPGMSQYTDASFGFSFWHPSAWAVRDPSPLKTYLAISGGTIVKSISVGPEGDSSKSILIQEFVSAASSITDKTSPGPADGVAAALTYRFDPTIHSWTEQRTAYDNSMTTRVLSSFNDTIGGLHLFNGNARFGDDVIVPLSASHFLVISSVDAGTIQEGVFAKTISATDAAVATPASASEQIDAIRTEGLLYGIIGKAVGEWYVDGQHVYDHLGNVIAGADPFTFKVVTAFSDGTSAQSTGFAVDATHVFSSWSSASPVLADADPLTFVPIRIEYQIPYAQNSGKYGQSFATYDTTFAIDGSHAWYEGKLIPGADPSTFVVTGNTHVLDSFGGYTLAHDAKHSYGVDAKGNIAIDGKTI